MVSRRLSEADDAEKGESSEQSPLLTSPKTPLSNTPRSRSAPQRRHTMIFAELQSKKWTLSDAVGTMSSSAFIINMFADICPAGFLPLASGLKGTGYVAALLLVTVLCALCIYTMWVVGETARITGKNTFRSQWEVTLGKQTAWMPVLVIVLVALGSCVAYSCFCADLLADGLPSFGVKLSRDACLYTFTFFILMPLCMLKDLSALAYSSAVAVLMITYTAYVMILRAADGSYAPGGIYFQHLPEAPQVPKQHFFECSFESINLINYLAMGYLAHYNACKYYRELSNHTPTRMKTHSGFAMGLTSAFYIVMMTAGFQTFGMSSHDVILQNYVKQDTLANVAQIGVAFSILVSFPIMFSGLREALIDVLCIAWPSLLEYLETNLWQNALSMIVLALITLCSHVFTDAGMVVGVVGAICGSAIIYIVPCILYVKALQKFCNKEKHHYQISMVSCLAVLGVLFAILGLVSALLG